MASLAQILFEYVSPFLAVIILVLNIAEVYTILRQKIRIKYSAIAYVFNLAISDIFVGVAIVIAKISYYIWKHTNCRTAWIILNVSRYYLLRVSLFASVLNLMTITLIRSLAITQPLKHRIFIRKYTKKLCLLIWVFSTLMVTCLYFSLYFTLDHAKFDQYEVILFPITVYPASVAFGCSYYHIRNLLIRNETKFNQRKFSQLSCSISKNPQNKSKKNSFEDKVYTFALRTIFAFIICWTPSATYSLIKVSNAFSHWKNVEDLEFSLFTLAFTNSVIDPILFFSSTYTKSSHQNGGSKNFRSTIKDGVTGTVV